MIEWLLLLCTDERLNINKISRKTAEKSPQFSDVTKQLVQRDAEIMRGNICYRFPVFSFDLSKVFMVFGQADFKVVLKILCFADNKCLILRNKM